ncbi:MAG: ankyrin repeat domain-containing protein [Kofleriaceae bacterium]
MQRRGERSERASRSSDARRRSCWTRISSRSTEPTVANFGRNTVKPGWTSVADHELREAAGIHGSTEAVRACLARGADPNATPTGNDSALSIAVMYDRLDAVKLLLAANADLEHAGNYGYRPIHHVRGAGGARLLLAHGASLGRTGCETGEDPLHEVIKRADDVETARVLLDGGLEVIRYGVPGVVKPQPSLLEIGLAAGSAFVRALIGPPHDEGTSHSPPRSHLEWVAWNHRPGIARLLLERGGSPNELSADGAPAVFRAFELGWGPAVRPGFYEIVRIFLEAGVDPNIKGNRKESLLYRLAGQGDASLVALALRQGGDGGGVTDMFGHASSLLIPAATSGDVDVAKVLLEAGAAGIDDVFEGDVTALMAAATEGHIAMVEFLLELGADPQRRSADGATALHFAARAPTRDVFDRLLASGCGLSDERSDEWTAFDVACAANRVAVVQAALERGVPIDRRVGPTRATPLIVASTYGARDVTSLLLASGADASLVDSDGLTAAMHAELRADEAREQMQKRWDI